MVEPCFKNVRPPDIICGGPHCTTYVDTELARSICKCVNYDGTPIPGCIPKTDAYAIETASCFNAVENRWLNISDDACQDLRDKDRNWKWKKCFCCCSCVAWGTQVLVSKGIVRSIEKIVKDDPVMAATVTQKDGAPVVTWKQRAVIFSDGTTPAEVSHSVRLTYGEAGEIVCTGDQPLVLADGHYIQADRVQAGMELLDDQGRPTQVTWVELGTHTVGLWHIATDAPDLHTMDDHLVSFNGLLAGDFIAQQILGQGLQADDRPALGTASYTKVSGSSLYSGLPGREAPPVRAKGFVAYRTIERMSPPADAARFLNALQAQDVRRNAPSESISSGYNRAQFDRLVRLYRGFFPEIHIVCQWEAEEPNLFAFDAFGVKTVLVTGGLLRITTLGPDGLALILAHGVARFLGAPPADDEGYACTGQADYFAVGYLINQAFYGTSFEVLETGIPEVKELFGYIDPAHRGGVDRCDNPGIDCRILAIGAARSGLPLPECAGAPIPNALKLERAEVLTVDDLSGLALTFNMPLSAASLGNVTNYLITPVSSVQYADIDPMTPEVALLTVRFAAERTKPFEVTVRGVRAADGSTLDPAHASASFEAPK